MVTTAQDFIDAMGGAKALRESLGITPQAIWQAKKLNRIPIRWTVRLAHELKAKRIVVAPSLLGIEEGV